MIAAPFTPALEATAEGQRILARDWSRHALGPLASWDQGLLSALAYMLPMGVPAALLWGPDARLFFNGAFEQAFSDRNLVQGQSVGDTSDALWKSLVSYRAGGSEVSIAAKGVTDWWQVNQSPLHDAEGRVRGRLVLLFNIAARKLAEQALVASEEAMLGLMDQQPRYLWRTDPVGRPIWINRLGRQFIGVEKMEGLDLSRIILSPDLAVLMTELQGHLATKTPMTIQVRVRSASAGVRWCLMHFTPLTDVKGAVHAWAGSGVDIQHWHDAASAATRVLAEHEGPYGARPAYDRYGREQFAFVADIETGRMRPLDPVGGQEWGLNLEGPPELWADWLMRLPPDQRERADDTFSIAAEGGVAEDLWTVFTPDGTERDVHVTVFSIESPDGVVRKLGGVLAPVEKRPEQRIYLIDMIGDDPAQRGRLARCLSLLGARVHRFDSLEDFAISLGDLRRGAVVIRSGQPRDDLGGALDMLSRNRAHFPWLVLAQSETTTLEVVELMRNGAQTVLPPDVKRAELLAAVREAIPPPVKDEIVPSDSAERIAALSKCERQVLEGLLAGGTNKVIAAQLNLSPRTVEAHRAHLMDRLGARSLADLMRIVGPHYLAEPSRRNG
ncbi:LuxR C-terminal-related transcriptional regulator [uncultured Brevundimonas sp.]|uniref:LuxR C-terminal-related transcriptional regulator n=1 Tax=uncultured Brevundimonas sp. TaxID=213418 RepID=UPI002633CE0D|nr:LuxR C-terminal-related transcriptional regulator [uncultured Brevundimonas sp.]